MLDHVSHWDCAARLLQGAPLPKELAIKKMTHTRVAGDHYLVTGVDNSFEIVKASLGEEETHSDVVGDGPVDVDWDEGVLPRRPASTGDARRSGGPSGHKRHSEQHAFDVDAVTEKVLMDAVPAGLHDVLCVDWSEASGDSDDDFVPDVGKPDDGEAEESSGAHVGDREEPSLRDDSAPTVAHPVAHADVPNKLDRVNVLKDLLSSLDNIDVNFRWEVHSMPYSRENVFAKIRCIQGHSLRIDCLRHRGKCKLHVDICGRFEASQCACIRWAVYGLSCDHDSHVASAAVAAASWRAFCRE